MRQDAMQRVLRTVAIILVFAVRVRKRLTNRLRFRLLSVGGVA